MAIQNLDIRVAVNEYLTRYSFNRNIEKLLQNDRYLAELYFNTIKSMNTVQYVSGTTYEYNDIVWYKDDATGKLYILKCIIDENAQRPDPNDFISSGWQNQQENIDIFKYNVKNWIYQLLNEKFAEHEKSSRHRFGNTEDYVNKILKSDLSNVRSDRLTNIFPSKTGKIRPLNDVLDGTYRVWDCGLLELDILYRMHLSDQIVMNNMSCDVVKANDLALMNGHMRSPTAGNYNENDNYFNSSDSYDIFRSSNSLSTLIGNMINTNQHKDTNAYYANITFPSIAFNGQAITGFKDINYMIFASDVLAAGDYDGNIMSNQNSMTYVNKNNYSFTAVYLLHGTDRGLNANSFHCQIVGKWK